ncbi:MAG: hypothetical protein E6Q95_05340 [Chitinophagaceae bacterium]|nr:MAG: hypothetical protein E6Q95_05340 [Chitinophagaceae bacterium]
MKRFIHNIMGLAIATTLLYSCKPDLGNYVDGYDPNGADSTNVEVDTSTLLTNKSKYAKARIFPGLVCDDARVDTTIMLSLNYTQRRNDELRISQPPIPVFSTGLYAAPGDLVTIEVPAGMYGLTVQLGAWTDNLSGKESEGPLARDPLITTSKALIPGTNTVRNLYGGHIYIIPSKPVDNPVQLKFKRVCESPDFVLGQTTNAAWHQKIQSSCVPWLELRSDYITFVVSREYCLNQKINDPQALMTEWETAIKEDFFGWMGLTENAADPIDESPKLPYRVVFDIQPSVGYGHNGNPIVVTNDYHWFSFSTDLQWLKGSNSWGTYHEIGHNAQMGLWSWSTLGETTNNLFNYKLARRNELSGYPNAWPAKHDCWTCIETGNFNLALAYANGSGVKNFDGDADINDPFRRMVPFLQIFDFIKPNMAGVNLTSNEGWDFMPYLYKQGRRALRQPTSNILKHDFVYTNLCDYTGINWQPFFEAWGITLSNIAIANMTAKYPMLNKEVWKYNPLTRTGGNTVIPDPYLRTSWKIVSFSSEEAGGEGPINGRAAVIIDGDPATFWHSRWSSNTANPPHSIVIDFTKKISFNQFYYAQRSSGGRRIKNLHIEVSNDNVTWTTAPGSPFLMSNTNFGLITYTFPSTVSARYIRIGTKVNADVYDGTNFAAIGEFGIIKP